MISSRKLTQFERLFFGTKDSVQLVVEFDKPGIVNQAIDNFKKAVTGLYLKTDGVNLISHNDPVKLTHFPSHITNVRDAADWITTENFPNMEKELATLTYNDTMIGVNMYHAIGDGGFLHYLYDHVLDSNIGNHPQFPSTMDQILSSQYKNATEPKDETGNITTFPNTVKLELNHQQNARYYQFNIPADQLAIYDKSTKKVKGLTESMWLNLYLSMTAVNGTQNQIGISTCVDIRQFIPRNINNNPLSFGNLYTLINCVCPKEKLSMDMTLGEIGKLMRENFSKKVVPNGEIFGALRNAMTYGFPPPTDITQDVFGMISNVGQFKVKKPIKNLQVQQMCPGDICSTHICLMSFSKVFNDLNQINCRIRYSPQSISDYTAEIMCKLMEHGMREIPFSTSLKDALKEIKDFQRSIQ